MNHKFWPQYKLAPGPDGGNIKDLRLPHRALAFRFNAKSVFLTYPRADLSYDVLLDKLVNGHDPEVVSWLLCREQHEDGALHAHALLSYCRKLHTRDATGTWKVTIRKLNPYEISPDLLNTSRSTETTERGRRALSNPRNFQPWKKRSQVTIIESGTYDDFMRNARLLAPRDAVLFGSRLESYARQRYCPEGQYQPDYVLTDFREVDILRTYREEYLTRPQANHRPKSLIFSRRFENRQNCLGSIDRTTCILSFLLFIS